MKRNELGFITEIDPIIDKDVCRGSSVCNDCGLVMMKCWHVVCKGCNKTFCYNCSKDIDDYWFCNDCSKEYKNEKAKEKI